MLHGSVEDLPAARARAGRRRVEARAAFELGLRLGDLLLLPGMAVLSHIVLYGAAAPDSSQRIVFGAVILSAIVCFSVAPLYRNWRMRGLLADLWLLLLAWSATFALFSLYVVLVGLADAVPSTWLIGWYAFGLGSMAALRVLLRVQLHRLRSRGMDHERILLVGLRAPALRLHRLLRGKPELGKDVIGYFASAGDIAIRRGGDAPCRLGRLEDVPQYMDQHRGEFDQVWVSMPMGHAAAIKDMLKQIERFPVPVRLIPDTTGLGALNPGVHQVGDVPMIGVRQGLVDHRFRVFKRVAKRRTSSSQRVAAGQHIYSEGPAERPTLGPFSQTRYPFPLPMAP